jgi:protein-S-isoprenylcysteine O-methyltransferase Ste14
MDGLHFPKAYADGVARLRVAAGFVLVAAFAWFSEPTRASLAAGLPVAVAGLLLRAWAAGHLAKNRELACSGPYAYTRNPLYLGTLLVAAGLTLAARSVWLGLVFTAVFLLVYLPVIELEQQHLRKLFPEYAAYAARVPMLWPRRRRARKNTNPFRMALYLRNQEYNAGAGFAAGMLFLFWKTLRG